jgi:hypothetical protein
MALQFVRQARRRGVEVENAMVLSALQAFHRCRQLHEIVDDVWKLYNGKLRSNMEEARHMAVLRKCFGEPKRIKKLTNIRSITPNNFRLVVFLSTTLDELERAINARLALLLAELVKQRKQAQAKK